MKTKYLFGMLVSGAMLAACTADDDFSTAKKVAQDVNPSAPVFTIVSDGDDLQNRATYGDDGFLDFEEKIDKMSLFHGIAVPSNRIISDGYELNHWQNAIYTKTIDQQEAIATWTTPSIVNKGLALMVYPGDTERNNPLDDTYNTGVSAPNIEISLKQDADYKNLTPYMSDFIEIADNPGDDKTKAESGYDKPYEIALKKVGSSLRLRLATKELTERGIDIKALGLAPIKIKRVELVNHQTTLWGMDKEIDGLFTYSVPVKMKANASGVVLRPAAWVDKKSYQTWYGTSDLDLENAKGKDVISSSDVKEFDDYVEVYFTLLPFRGKEQADGTIKWEAFEADKVTERNMYANGVELVAYTNYGKVVMNGVEPNGTDHDGEKIWYGSNNDNSREQAKSITDGLLGIANLLWNKAENNGLFKNTTDATRTERVGARITRWVDVDYNRMNMDGLHVENEKELCDAIELYKRLYPASDQPATFYLDGTDNVFQMHQKTWTKVDSIYTVSSSKVVCMPCGDQGEVCTTIELVSDDNNTPVEIPNLHLGTNTDNAALGTDGLNQNDKATLLLKEGKWKYTNLTASSHIKVFYGIYNIVVGEDAEVEMNNYINAFTDDSNNKLAGGIDNYGTITVSGTATLSVDTQNYGTIEIAENKHLRLNHATLENKESQTPKATGLFTTDRGVINNAGRLACDASNEGIINNYGLINHAGGNANITVISNNSTITTTRTHKEIGNKFGRGTDKVLYGTIDMGYTASEFVSVENSYDKGFVKLHVKTNDPTSKDLGYANYVVAEEGCTHLKTGTETVDGQSVTYWKNATGGDQLYLEIATKDMVVLENNFVLKGLVIGLNDDKTARSAWIGNGSNVRIGLTSGGSAIEGSGCIYMKGFLYGAGTVNLEGATFEGYFGGDKTDVANVQVGKGN